MKITISDRAGLLAVAGESVHTPINWHWVDVMSLVQGLTLDVETRFLFANQYNTAPLPADHPGLLANVQAYTTEHPYRQAGIAKALESITGMGLRIMQRYVTAVIDDERPGKGRCRWCGKISTLPADPTHVITCEHCGKSEYMEVF